tara:strand:- start:53 stop:277 length:225 start_codon:yes stop_codon:yes gene_type:complete
MKNLAVEALRHRYEGQKKSAEYIIKNYFFHPAAIGEHPNLLAEIDKAFGEWSEANGKLQVLEIFKDDEYQTLFD